MTREGFVKSLTRENQEFYGTQDGRGALWLLELVFEHRWSYVFELVQNALDAKARSIAFRLSDDGDALTFQHDGQELIDEDVERLSKVFRSNKGATSVGFMGLGFKSVFGRFREARVSGWGWTFRYKTSREDRLGMVLPIWDGGIAEPEAGFTTRFELRNRVDPDENLQSDLTCLPSDNHPTLLAILADAGLQRLDVNGRVWKLSVDYGVVDGSKTATACSDDEERRWQLFPVEFEPSSDAIRYFLEYRNLQAAGRARRVLGVLPSGARGVPDGGEASTTRRVLGVLPLNDRGVPERLNKGRIYATLPTEVELPLGFHVHADWLLTISRTGLREIEHNPWQQEIVDRIADVLAGVLGWAARTFSEPDSAKAAFAALAPLAPPSPKAGGLEASLAGERWLSRLRCLLEDASVLPVWAAETGALGFAKPSEAIVPPAPFAKAFEEEPALRPAALLRGPVLNHQVLGEGGRKLLDRAGLLVEMSSSNLEQAWAGGLESWWKKLEDNETKRRDLLFRVWGAVSELTSDEAWPTTNLPCIRTAGGAWRSVDESVFDNEPLPSEGEPDGSETRRFMQPFIPDAKCHLADDWIRALRQAAEDEEKRQERGHLSQAWEWIEKRARSIGLRELVESAVNGLEASATPDWSVLVPLGRWAMHRKRHDLLIRVLVESPSGGQGVPAGDALLAEPYVRGQNRECLFPNTPMISAAYLEDPETTDPHEWREFFEKAGAKGALAVPSIERGRVDQGDYERVAEFLGLRSEYIREDHHSNNQGYLLQDFDVEPALPGPNEHEKVRAVAAWLDDGSSELRGRGHRRAKYEYSHIPISCRGERSSAWVAKLSKLAWVPCDDHQLRRPRDVLPQPDPARESAPVAKVSSALLSRLEQEGVKFGVAVPEATALQQLLKVGSQLAAEELAELLREVREQVATEADRHLFERFVPKLVVRSVYNECIPLTRIVQRVGGWYARGALGGWIVPLGHFHDRLGKELNHLLFPYWVPETTTGEQALAYLRWVWERADSSPVGLASKVSNFLPTAYAYCLEDMNRNVLPARHWKDAVREAKVFDGREWISPANADIYLDDIEGWRFLPHQGKLRTATGGHLGNSREQRLRTAEKLGLRPLSEVVKLHWSEGGELLVDDAWAHRFELVCRLLRAAKGSGRTEEEEGRCGNEPEMGWHLRRVECLALEVTVEGAPAYKVPVNARLYEGRLTVAGRPIRFGADAANELLRALSFGQRDLSAALTAMLTALGSAEDDFAFVWEKFRQSFAPDVPPRKRNVRNNSRDDEKYREAAAKYERECGRDPEFGDANQKGWDLRSTDPETEAVRLIVVKGRGRSWEGDEVVELSNAQVRKAFEMSSEQAASSWYLYVVDRTKDGSYEVRPIGNPVHIGGKWILRGGPLRMRAEEPRRYDVVEEDGSGDGRRWTARAARPAAAR